MNSKQHALLMAALFITGALALVLEIVGTRVISPFYGSSIFCWSALITVTLVALALGYHLGGKTADREASLLTVSRLLALAAAAIAAVPLLRAPILRLTCALGVRLGALASAAILIAPALLLLSMLNPIAIRLTASQLDTVGRRAGSVYAISTIGSVAGAILAGFVLIPNFSISQVFYGAAAMLLLLSALCRGWGRAQAATAATAAAVAAFGFWPRSTPKTNLLLNHESAYGQIKVIDVDGASRYLMVNGTSQSVALLPSLESDSQYIHALEIAPLLRPQARQGLVVGLGAGLLPTAWERHHGLAVDAVEIDPDIVSAAKKYFGYAPRGRIFVEDGRTFLERSGERYGLMLLDAFASESPPYHLFSREAFSAMKRRLEPQGLLAVNIVTLVESPGDQAWLAAYKTLKTVFPEVRAFVGSDVYEGLANVLIFASDAPLAGAKTEVKPRPAAAKDIAAMLSHELVPEASKLARAPVLSDDHAPLEFLLSQTACAWRRSLQAQVAQVMLY